jgi:hypothetical protein
MKITKALAPPNSVLLVMDRNTGEPPKTMGGGLAAATSSCVAIGTLSEVDGQTSVAFSNRAEPADAVSGMEQVFDGAIATPSREVRLCTTTLESIATLPVPTTKTRVRVWGNHSSEPDRLLIVVTAA